MKIYYIRLKMHTFEDYLNALEDLISIKAQAIHYEED